MAVERLRPWHVVRRTEVGNYLSRHLKDPDIITIWNEQTQNWMLGHWVDKDKGYFNDIDDLGPHFEEVTREFVLSLERTRHPTDWKRQKARLLLKERREMQSQEADIYESQERYNWLKKRTADKAPIPYMIDVGSLKQGGASSRPL